MYFNGGHAGVSTHQETKTGIRGVNKEPQKVRELIVIEKVGCFEGLGMAVSKGINEGQ